MRPLPVEAGAQGGVFTRAQALSAGFSYASIRRRVEIGEWRVVAPNVFARADQRIDARGRIFAAAWSTGGAVSHWSAAGLLRLSGFPTAPNDSAHVISKRPLHANVPGVVEHRLRLFPEHWRVVDGIRVTTPARTVVDVLAASASWDARSLVFRAVQEGWIDRDSFADHIRNRSGWHGTPQLRELLTLLRTGAHGMSEVEAHRILDRAGIRYDANVRLVLPGGRVAVADLLIRGTRIVIEIDGFRYHSSDERFQTDRDRQNALVGAGFVVLRFTWRDLMTREAYVVETIRRHLDGLSA
jgi:Protein of unknown function (DUF559)